MILLAPRKEGRVTGDEGGYSGVQEQVSIKIRKLKQYKQTDKQERIKSIYTLF